MGAGDQLEAPVAGDAVRIIPSAASATANRREQHEAEDKCGAAEPSQRFFYSYGKLAHYSAIYTI
jgi:hypothetical protein